MNKNVDQEHIPLERIEQTILIIRGNKVIIDADLAKLYDVSTKALNQAIKRNYGRFPSDFLFQLTAEEKEQVVTVCDHLKKLKYSSQLPYAFTEHGILMAATVLNSEKAIDVSIAITRAFIHLRKMLSSHTILAQRLNELEKKYDQNFAEEFAAIKLLMEPPEESPKSPIGFSTGE